MTVCPRCGLGLGPLQDCPNPPCVTADNNADYSRQRAEEDDR